MPHWWTNQNHVLVLVKTTRGCLDVVVMASDWAEVVTYASMPTVSVSSRLSQLRLRCPQANTYMIWLVHVWGHYTHGATKASAGEFLRLPSHDLDLGVSLPLQRIAKAQGPDRAQLEFLLSAKVQEALVLAFSESTATSLPAERYFAQAKRNEAPRLCHVATAGRNLMLRQFLRERSDILGRLNSAAEALRKALKTSFTSLAWEFAGASGQEVDSADTQQYARDNKAMLVAEAQRRRARCRERLDD